MGIIAMGEASLESKMLDIYAQGGAFAESILSTPRTIHAFGIRERLVASYDEYLLKAKAVGDKKGPLMGFLFSIEYFLIYCGMAVAFWQGVKMVSEGSADSLGTVFTYVQPTSTHPPSRI